jgi:hypothetical protein
MKMIWIFAPLLPMSSCAEQLSGWVGAMDSGFRGATISPFPFGRGVVHRVVTDHVAACRGGRVRGSPVLRVRVAG